MRSFAQISLFLILITLVFAAKSPKLGHGVGVGLSSFSSAISAAQLSTKEFVVFNYTVPLTSDYGAVTHWWATGSDVDNAILRFYVDDEADASIELVIDLSVGIGFNDDRIWGASKFGKNAKTGGVFNNMRIPFQKSIVITMQGATTGVYWWIVRGLVSNGAYLPIHVGGVPLPKQSRLRLATFTGELAPLQKLTMLNVTDSAGVLYFVALAVSSDNLNFLEGCVRCFIDGGSQMLVSSGTEDYFDSAFYFDGGAFQGPNAGLTHIATNGGSNGTEVAAYRFHDEDPLFWSESFALVWRNGDTNDPATGQKCINDSGPPNGNPGPSQVTSYVWYYTWDE